MTHTRNNTVDVCLVSKVLTLALAAVLYAPLYAADYSKPKPAKDISAYGNRFQRSMTLMATSTPQKRNTLRILFYGQSIVGQQWHTMVADDLRHRFPHTDFVIENRAIGGFSSQLLVRTMYYDVIPFYPDLIIFHVYGAHDKYEEIIRTIRSRTTAEVIMQSDHANVWPEPKCAGNFWAEQKNWDDKMNYFLLPAIAEKYGCAWQPQRWEWVDYLEDNNLQPADLLKDSVHLNEQGRWLMAELLKRFLVYLPDEPTNSWRDLVKTYVIGRDTRWQNGKLVLTFEGNRVVALAAAGSPAKCSVLIDGRPVSEHPECHTFTRPSGTPGVGWPCIKNIGWQNPPLLESWQALCTGFNENQDAFTFTVKGSETGLDGRGKASERFISDSGRIVIEPDDWVFAYDKQVSTKKAPDGFAVNWTVELMGTDEYTPSRVEDPAKEYPTVLASNLSNESHTLELTASNGGIPSIKALVVYKPPFK